MRRPSFWGAAHVVINALPMASVFAGAIIIKTFRVITFDTYGIGVGGGIYFYKHAMHMASLWCRVCGAGYVKKTDCIDS